MNIYYKQAISNKKLSINNSNEVLELDNISSIFSQEKLKIKLLEHNISYDIKHHSNDYALNISFL